MAAMEILVNGQQLCIAQTEDFICVTATVRWMKIPGAPEKTWVSVSPRGLTQSDELVQFPMKELATGDEVTVRILESEDGSVVPALVR